MNDLSKIKTVWSASFNRNSPLSEYPRPQMQRDSYICLNGVWKCIMAENCERLNSEKDYEGEIVVPFSPEAPLSGVNRILKDNEVLRYSRNFSLPKDFNKGRVLLHIGATDQYAKVIVNETAIVTHSDGYIPFSADITDYLINGENTLDILVWDWTEKSGLPRGKQSSDPKGIWYTSQSGIWQTVWLESVPETYIEYLTLTPDIDNNIIKIKVSLKGKNAKDTPVTVSSKLGSFKESSADGLFEIKLTDTKLWSPENPFLYDLTVTTRDDEVESYFAMRKFAVTEDDYGVMRFHLNNKPYFCHGVLDQGYWPDGLYTPPSDEAFVYDITEMKNLGFNTLRKHIKIEPLRWYYHCDRLGMLVWQDMVNGGGNYSRFVTQVMGFTNITIKDNHYKLFAREDEKAQDAFSCHIENVINLLYNSPCVAVWTIFNEGWGQFDANFFTDKVWKLDSTRPVDHASGWIDQGGGDFKSLHIYYKKVRLPQDSRAIALTEFGGYSLKIEGHTACNKPFGYKRFESTKTLNTAINALYNQEVFPLIKQGLCAAIYTQLSDVENELNGLITYDRKVVKLTSPIIPPCED